MPADTLIETLSYFEKMLPSFFSDRAQFTITFPNMANVWQEEHPDAEVHIEENNDPQDDPQDVPQDGTQGGTQGGTQYGTQDENIHLWLEKQMKQNPTITTEELAELSGKSIRTIKRRIAEMPSVRYVGSGYSGHWEVE